MNDKLISFLRRREEGNPKQISFFYILRFNCVRYFGFKMYKPSSGGLAEKDHSRSRSSKAQMYSDYKNCVCYIAGWKFLLNSAPLIGYFEVTRHLLMKLFPGKIFAKSATSEANSEPRLYSEVS